MLEESSKDQLSGRERLEELQNSGEFVFHGSHKRLDKLEPRQPMTFDEKQGKSIPDGDPAVCTTPFASIATFRSLISSHRDTERGQKSHFSQFDLGESGKPVFGANEESLRHAREDGIVGYVHVFSKNDFKKRDNLEWRSDHEVKPVEVIEVKATDLPDNINVVESPAR